MATTSRAIADGQHPSSRPAIGNIGTCSFPSMENHSRYPNGQSASEYLGHLLGIDSLADGLSIEHSQLLLPEIEPETAGDISKPLVIDLFAGSFGWSAGFIPEGYRSIGFDLEHHDYHGPVPAHCHLVLADVQLLRGAWFRNAAVIVASPPCQAYSYRAMPWKRAKALPPPDNTLFNECFRIQREASEAAGHYIPLIVENVRGAQKWVGRARWAYGSFYLWGDVPALMPTTLARKIVGYSDPRRNGGKGAHLTSQAENDGRKVSMNFHEHEKTGRPGRSFQSAAVAETGLKGNWLGWDKTTGKRECKGQRATSSGSKARKAASAMIAKIPFPLAQHIARCYKPEHP